MTNRHWLILFILVGTGNLANGLWMLWDPAGWYTDLPAAVPDFGPLNEHFIRDLGTMFTVFGLSLYWAARTSSVRIPVVGIQLLWFTGHSLVHAFDTLRGAVGPEHWFIDLPLVYVPTLIHAVLFYLLSKGGGPDEKSA